MAKKEQLEILETFKDYDGRIIDVEEKVYDRVLSPERRHALTTKENKEGRPFLKITEVDVPDEEEKEGQNLEGLTVDELKKQAEEKGLEHDSKAKKADPVKLLSE